MNKLVVLTLFALTLSTAPSYGQNLALDDTFGFGGVAHAGASDRNDTMREMLTLPDGKFILIGDSHGPSNDWNIVMAKFHANGQPDTSFGTEGVVFKSNDFRAIPYAASLQADGKIVVVGTEAPNNGVSSITASVFRFNPDGSDDTSFGDNGTKNQGFNGALLDTHVQDDGKIVAMGTNYTSRSNVVIRMFEDGERDTTFTLDGLASRGPSAGFGGAYSAKIAPNGSVFTASARLDGSSFFPILTATNMDGEADTTFNSSGTVSSDIALESTTGSNIEIEIDDSGYIYLGSNVSGAGGAESHMIVAKYTPEGSLDTSFGDNGKKLLFIPDQRLSFLNLSMASDGGLYVMGRSNQSAFGIGIVYKLDSNGLEDPLFQGGGHLDADINADSGTHWITDVWEAENGSLILSAYDFASGGGDLAIAKFTPMVNTSIEVPFEGSSLELYPNPVTQDLTLNRDLSDGYEFFELYDSLGRQVLREELSASPRNQWSLRHLPKGSYFAKISGSEKYSVKSIIVL